MPPNPVEVYSSSICLSKAEARRRVANPYRAVQVLQTSIPGLRTGSGLLHR